MNDRKDSPLSGLVTPNIFCRRCASPLVQALDWEQEKDGLWSVTLWCPECRHEQAATLDRPQLLYLALAVEEGFAWVLDALSELDSDSLEHCGADFARRAQTERIRPSGH